MTSLNIRKKEIACLVVFVVLLVFYYFSANYLFDRVANRRSKLTGRDDASGAMKSARGDEQIRVSRFDLTKPLEPVSLYEPITCVPSMVYIVRTTLCIHDLKRDIHVSGSILNHGAWEPHILSELSLSNDCFVCL